MIYSMFVFRYGLCEFGHKKYGVNPSNGNDFADSF